MFTQIAPKPPIVTISGPSKIGKTSAAVSSGKTALLQTEDSGDGIKCFKTPLLLSFTGKDGVGGVLDSLEWLGTQSHDYTVAAIDSLDWMERLIHKQICAENNVSNLEKIGYGKGYIMAIDLWSKYIDCIKYLRDNRDMMIVQIAHTQIKRFENPETEPYDRYELKLHKSASDLIMESSDIILFANYFVGVTKSEVGGFKKTRTRAVGSGERVLYTEERPAFKAGNRFNLPSEIPFDREGQYWNTIKSHIPYYQTTTKGE